MRSLLAALMLVLTMPALASAQCQVRTGDHVILYGASDDPDVFAWDSRFRLREYQGGSWDQGQALLPHAELAEPGTRAIVQECVSNFVLPKYATLPDDAVGVMIVNGRLRGKFRWVLGADVRPIVRERKRHE